MLLFLRHPLAAADGFTRTPPQHNPTQLQLQLPETVRYLLSSSPKLMEILRLDTDMYLFGGNLIYGNIKSGLNLISGTCFDCTGLRCAHPSRPRTAAC